MKDRLEDRLKQLQSDYEAGQKMLADLEAKRQGLASTLLRIEGAMQVLREVLGKDGAAPEGDPAGRLEPPAG